MKIVLFNQREQLCEAWGKEFHDYGHEVTIFQGALEDVPQVDCLVCPGNSFGIMDDGLAAAIKLQFPDAQQNVREAITVDYCGEIPVGTSIIVPSNDETFPYMAYTPTMRFPRNITAETVYDCMRATLLAVRAHNVAQVENEAIADLEGDEFNGSQIESIAIPGFGTGTTGGVGAFKAARMMRLGYESIYVHEAFEYEEWDQVDAYLNALYSKP